MTHKHCMDALDRLRDIIRKPGIDYNDLPFGGITVVFGGDFRQTLPIIPKATITEIVNYAIKRSYLWDHMIVMKLCQNMRLHKQGCTSYEATEIASFIKWIIDIGDDDPVIDIVDATYNAMQENYENKSYFAERAVLAPLHETVSLINDYMLTKLNGDEVCCYSSDTIQTDGVQSNDDEAEFPTEILNSMKIGNFPEHQLKLKVGAPVILLRTIDQSTGLCNGTRMIIQKLGTWSIEVEVVTGSHIGDRVHLPRRQYPIALCFGMTINKSQGQTLNHVGICMYRQVCTHGQLYVALS
ncbi:ATP-dependent DNA helicase PIF1 [Linum perenne]